MEFGTNSTRALEFLGVSKTYVQGRWWEKKFYVHALDRVNLILEAGRTLALVGRSGSGKTTLALCAALLEVPDSGSIWFYGHDILSLNKQERALFRPRIQIIFQDSTALPARYTARQIIEEPLLIQHRYSAKERAAMVATLMEQVGLPPRLGNRFADQFSGGQRQRLAIARSLILQPTLLVLDEPFVGLDLSTRAKLINLLTELQAQGSLTYLYISHDLETVRNFADSVAVMEHGAIIQQASVSDFFADPGYNQSSDLGFAVAGTRDPRTADASFDKVKSDLHDQQSWKSSC